MQTRNIFDQYNHPENRLTHALVCCLAEDRALLRAFVNWTTGQRLPKRHRLNIVEQRLPGEESDVESPEDAGALPDGWVYDDDGWALLIESKVSAAVTAEQLRRHLIIASRRGFEDVRLLLLTAKEYHGVIDERVVHRPWTAVYEWMSRQGRTSTWARRLVQYMRVAESRMIADGYLREGTITMFDGFPFSEDEPYNYREGKRLLNQAMLALRQRKDLLKLGMHPKLPGRPAITGRGRGSVWDFLRLSDSDGPFTDYPHLTLSVGRENAHASVTLPHAMRPQLRRRLVELGPGGFRDMLSEIERKLRPLIERTANARPVMYALQRHHRTQRSAPVTDARLEFDLRTAVGDGSAGVKLQPQWCDALYDVLSHRKSNTQFGIGVWFGYPSEELASRQALDLIAETWRGCEPLLRVLRSGARRSTRRVAAGVPG